MPFEARKTKFTVFSLNHEFHSLIKSAFNMKLESKSTRTYRYEDRGGEPIYCFLKACIVLNGLNKSFLHRESIEIQSNQAIVSSKRTLNICCRYVNYRPEATQINFFRASESQTVLILS